MNYERHNVGSHPEPSIYWSVMEMSMFDNGEVYARVLFVGSEAECDVFLAKTVKDAKQLGGFFHALPMYFKDHKLVNVALNCIATTTPGKVYKTIDVGKPTQQ